MYNLLPLPGRVFVHNFIKGERTTIGGIIIPNDDGRTSGIRARWAQVYKTGEGVDDVKEGQWILIEHGRWSRQLDIRSEDSEPECFVWTVDHAGILAVSDEKPVDEMVSI